MVSSVTCALHSTPQSLLAPTGSGKTVLFELGMIRMLTLTANDARPAKCIYVAPTKVRLSFSTSHASSSKMLRHCALRSITNGLQNLEDLVLDVRTSQAQGYIIHQFLLPLGCELTGDTLLLGRGVWGDAKSSHIMYVSGKSW